VVVVDVDVVVVGVSVVVGVVIETDDLTILGVEFFSFAFVDKKRLKYLTWISIFKKLFNFNFHGNRF